MSEHLWSFLTASPGREEPAEVNQVSPRFASWVSAWGGVLGHVLPGGDPKAKPRHNWGFKPLISSVSSSKTEDVAEERMVWAPLLKLLSPPHLRTTNHSWYHDVIFMKSIFWTTGIKRTDWVSYLFIAHVQEQQRGRHISTSNPNLQITCSECEVDETCDYVHQFKHTIHWCWYESQGYVKVKEEFIQMCPLWHKMSKVSIKVTPNRGVKNISISNQNTQNCFKWPEVWKWGRTFASPSSLLHDQTFHWYAPFSSLYPQVYIYSCYQTMAE